MDDASKNLLRNRLQDKLAYLREKIVLFNKPGPTLRLIQPMTLEIAVTEATLKRLSELEKKEK